ncbi:MAG: hypothetical protein KDC84_08620 [Crocinitomicaceae bacterium]|nr:hypothetical protein [Crocinitomicaceae bacterium]
MNWKLKIVIGLLLTLLCLPNKGLSQGGGYGSMPSPLQIVLIFQNPDLKYDSTLVHSFSETGKYKTKYKQIVNFGVYLADMAYAIQNKRNGIAIKYLHAIKELGEKCEINQMFNKLSIYERFESNLENKDSMMTILLDLSITFEEYLQDEEVMRLVGIQFAGIWVEGSYVASQIASFQSSESLNKLLVHQYPVLENIVDVLNNLPSQDPYHKELTSDLAELKKAMSEMKTIKKFMKKKYEIPLTEEELKIVEEKIRRIRTKMIAEG